MESLIGHPAAKVWAGTFHHIGNRLLRRAATLLGYQPNFTILDSEDQLDLIRLAMDDAGLSGTGKLAPKPAAVHHMISFSANVNRPLAQVIAERGPELVQWQSQIEAAAAGYARRKRAANCMDYDDLLLQWGRLIGEFPEQRALQGRMFQHILIDEMQDTNAVQIEVVEAIAAAGAGNLTAVGRRCPVDLPVPRRRLRQHPEIPRAASRRADLPARRQLPLDAPDRRVHQGLDRPQHDRIHQGDGLRPAGWDAPAGRAHRGRL